MSLAARASLRFPRRLAAPIHTLRSTLNAIGETGVKITHSNNNNRQCCQNHHRRSFATVSQKNAEYNTDNNGTAGINEKQDQESTLVEPADKNIIQRMFQKYSMSEQTNRILLAESLFQAATSQASDPWVQRSDSKHERIAMFRFIVLGQLLPAFLTIKLCFCYLN